MAAVSNGSMAGQEASAAQPKDESLWSTILRECGGSQSNKQFASDKPKRILIVGSYYAGKRTLAAKLVESMGEKRGIAGLGAASPERHSNNDVSELGASNGDAGAATATSSGKERARFGAGVDFSFVDVRAEDGTVTATVELLVVDTPLVIANALPTLEVVENATVLFVCDLSEPSSATHQIQAWSSAISTHVATLADSVSKTKLDELRTSSVKFWDESSTQFLKSRKRACGGTPPSNSVVLAPTSVCPLPAVVVGTKFDQYTRYCRQQPDVGSGEISRSKFGIEVLRKKALDLRAGFVTCNLHAVQSLQAVKGLWYWCLHALGVHSVTHPEPPSAAGGNDSFAETTTLTGTIGRQRSATLVAAQANPMYTPVELTIYGYVEPSIQYDVCEPCFLPHGSDFYEQLSGLVRTEDSSSSSTMWNEYFPSSQLKWPEVRSHQDTLKAMRSKHSAHDGGDEIEDWNTLGGA